MDRMKVEQLAVELDMSKVDLTVGIMVEKMAETTVHMKVDLLAGLKEELKAGSLENLKAEKMVDKKVDKLVELMALLLVAEMVATTDEMKVDQRVEK